MSNGQIIPFQPGMPTQQGNWMWNGTQWTCGPCDNVPPFPCPPPGFPPPGCPPWFGSPNSPPWYPGANAGVSFGTPGNYPANPVRGHFFWDGKTLWIFDGAAWDNVAAAPGSVQAPLDGFAYGQLNGNWARVLPLAGGTLTGPLILSGDPTTVLGAVTKQYADAHAGVQLLQPIYYTSSQTITIPAAAHQGLVQMWGATGGSGGVTNAGSGGTGAGGYLEKLLTNLTPGNTLIYVQGAGGTAGAINGAGGAGGVTTLASGSQSIGTLTCNGSTGSLGGTTFTSGTLGGTAIGGDINVTGQSGILGDNTGGATIDIPAGGRNFFSMGANGVVSTTGVVGNQGNPGGLKISWAIFSS